MLLSIITINFNNLVGLKRTVEGVIHQSLKEFEYILIDGGSTDGSALYIEEMKRHFDYWVSEPDRGIYHAMNKGIEVARGEYLLFLNSGDRFHNNEIIAQVFPMLDGHTQLFYGDGIRESTTYSIQSKYPDKLSFINFFSGGLNHQCIFFHKSLFENFGLYSEEYDIVSDWLFVVKILLSNISYKKLEMIISVTELGGLSSSDKTLLEIKNILKTEFSFLYDDYLQFYEFNQKLKSRRWLVKKLWKALIR